MVTRKYARNVWTEIICSTRSNEIYGFMVTGYRAVSELAEKQNNRTAALENSRREFEIRAKILEFAPIKTKLIESQKATAQRIANFESYLPAGKKNFIP
jgi:hypothetical protein